MSATSSRSPAGTQSVLENTQHDDRATRKDLLRRFEPLVQRVVWKLRPPLGYDRDDLAQEARLGLLAAIRAWRPERPVPRICRSLCHQPGIARRQGGLGPQAPGPEPRRVAGQPVWAIGGFETGRSCTDAA